MKFFQDYNKFPTDVLLGMCFVFLLYAIGSSMFSRATSLPFSNRKSSFYYKSTRATYEF